MNYLTAYYWQSMEKRNVCSLLLKQVAHNKGHNAVFACICEGRGKDGSDETSVVVGGYLTARLQTWFYEKALLQCEKTKGSLLQSLAHSLWLTICQAEKELGIQNIVISGIFCLKNRFFLFSKAGEIILLNTRFGRGNSQRLLKDQVQLTLQYGILQKGVGILLASKGFMEKVNEQLLRECLLVKELDDENRVQRHLQELCREMEKRGAEAVAGVLLSAK